MTTCLGPPVFRQNYLRFLKSASATSGSPFIAKYEFVKHFSLAASRCVQLPRISVDISDSALSSFKQEDFKARKHPGVLFRGKVCLPQEFRDAAQKILTKSSISSPTKSALEFNRYLQSRRLAIEDKEYKEIAMTIERKIAAQDAIMEPFLSLEQFKSLENKRFQQTKHALKKTIYHWESVNYVGPRVLDHLMVRSAAEYGALYKIFSEISKRDTDFKPASLLDFGSGLGTVQWAANAFWNDTLNEHLCVDCSRDMNDVAELILRGGNPNKQMTFPKTFYRQFLPTTQTRHYDLVTSSYSLLELPSAKARLEVLNTLWRKSANYIVLIEYGNRAGFKLINEARDFILRLDREPTANKHCHVFSPCPHDTFCPRFMEKNAPCNFYVHYLSLLPFGKEILRQEKYTYCVIKRGPRNPNDPNWPRLVDRPLKRSRHVVCRACMPEGKLSEIVLTKTKNSVDLYKSGRRSRQGDFLPVQESFVKKPEDEDMSTTETAGENDGNNNCSDGEDSDLETDCESDSDSESEGHDQGQKSLDLNSSSGHPEAPPQQNELGYANEELDIEIPGKITKHPPKV